MSSPVTLRLESFSQTEEAAAADAATMLQRTGIDWLRPEGSPRGPWRVDRTRLAEYFSLRNHEWLVGPQFTRPFIDRRIGLNEHRTVLTFVLAPRGALAWAYSEQPEAADWELVHRLLARMRGSLHDAVAADEFQKVGLIARDLIISLAHAVYDAQRHPSQSGSSPGSHDAKQMINDYLAVEAPGSTHATVRKVVGAVLELAMQLQHTRASQRENAAICLEATAALVSIFEILENRAAGK